eukprot:2216945-Amphidinium_carterae.1
MTLYVEAQLRIIEQRLRAKSHTLKDPPKLFKKLPPRLSAQAWEQARFGNLDIQLPNAWSMKVNMAKCEGFQPATASSTSLLLRSRA